MVVDGFLGTFRLRLDDKRRLFLPAKFRARFAEGLVMTKGQERCLYVWSSEGFTELASTLPDTPLTRAAARARERLLYANADEQTPDKQWRVSVRPELRAYAGIDRDCVLTGVNKRVEIWQPAAWEAYQEASEASYDSDERGSPGVD